MKLYPRITLPILAAVAVAAGTLGWAWMQLKDATADVTAHLQNALHSESGSTLSAETTTGTDMVDPGDTVLIHLRQGDLFALQGEWAKAEDEYQQAVQNGGGLAALHKLAQAELQRREIDKVKLTIQELKRQGAKTEEILLLQVIVDLRTGDLEKAKQALAEGEDTPQVHYGNSLVAIIEGRNEDAKKELQTTVNGWDPTLRSYARVLLSAYDEFALFEESKPIHLTTLLARALAQVQECELALPLLSGVLQENQDYRDAWTVQGYCELTTERFTEALSSFEHAYAIDPEKPEIQYFLGRTYTALGQWSNAETFLDYALVNGFEPEKEVRERLAAAAENAQDLEKASEQYRALVALPDADQTTFAKAITLSIQLGKAGDAYELGKSAVSRWPNSAEALALAGSGAAADGKTDEAKGYFEQALKIDPGNERAKAGMRQREEK